LPNVKILLIEDKAVSKEEYNTDYYWEKGARDIKEAIGKPIDAVFCGSDYLGTNRFESLYCPESEVIYFDRAEVPISSTDIRGWASKHWDYIPNVCKDYYTRKVLIVGSESTGKSTLVQNLALAYNTNFVGEYGRITCDYAGGEDFMNVDDLYENLLRQRILIMDAAKHSNRLLFVDTDAITTLFYSRFLLTEPNQIANCEKLASVINAMTQWDLVLFLEPDVAFVQDGTRNETIHADRHKYSEQIKWAMREHNVSFFEVTGDYLQRFEEAKRLITQELNITTDF
jgi:HTH-type transcriptional repressor of NAD biosynthesis genes